MQAASATPGDGQGSTLRGTKGYRGLAMEGYIARWYTRIRTGPTQLAEGAEEARRLAEGLPNGAQVLEVAPGPGVLAIELARLGRYQVTAVDISRTFVEIARERARAAGVPVAFHHGDAARLPFPDNSFDLVVSQAAFKNFRQPGRAIDEMFRVLRPTGVAVIQDMRKEAADDAIRDEVDRMGLGVFQAFATRRTLRGLRRRSYSRQDFERFARASRFGGATITGQGLGQEVRLTKPSCAPL